MRGVNLNKCAPPFGFCSTSASYGVYAIAHRSGQRNAFTSPSTSLAMYTVNPEIDAPLPARIASTLRELQWVVVLGVFGTR
jgi:hypothetical protein